MAGRLGPDGSPGAPLGGPRRCWELRSPAGGAGRMGSDMMFCMLEALDVREGCAGRGGAEAEPLESERVCGGERSRRRSRTAADDEAEGARWDLRLLCSIMLTAQASRSTGVRFAAWRNASCSCGWLVGMGSSGEV